MAITRRQFLKRSGAVAAGTLLGPSLFDNIFVRQALASSIGDHYFVVIFLDGGNDGLNTVVPASNGNGTLWNNYNTARDTGNGGLRLTPTDLQDSLIGLDPNTSAQLALHPGFYDNDPGLTYAGLKGLYDLGKVAVIQGCGYPSYSLSHDESRTIWRTANPLALGGLTGTGWAGRYLADPTYGFGPTEIPGVTIDDTVAAEFRQTLTSVLAIPRLRDFGFPTDDFNDGDLAANQAAFDALATSAGAGAQPTLRYIGNSAHATLGSTQSYPQLHSLYQSQRAAYSVQYDNLDSGTARRLREVAKVINGVRQGMPVSAPATARVFQLANGGYDTHSDQGTVPKFSGDTPQQWALHREVGDALAVFYDDLQNMGVINKVVVMVWSEFSRRIQQNANGTDHGSQGPMFVIGGSVNGGVYGNHPNINPSAIDDDGNTVYSQTTGSTPNNFRSTDFRDVYGTILKQWLNMPQATILSNVLPLDMHSPSSDYWNTANFNMPFLPIADPNP
jgi:uncharacterized protein (DUF1501 family)